MRWASMSLYHRSGGKGQDNLRGNDTLQVALFEAGGLRNDEDQQRPSISRGASQDLYWQGEDKAMESRHGSPLQPSIQAGNFPH